MFTYWLPWPGKRKAILPGGGAAAAEDPLRLEGLPGRRRRRSRAPSAPSAAARRSSSRVPKSIARRSRRGEVGRRRARATGGTWPSFDAREERRRRPCAARPRSCAPSTAQAAQRRLRAAAAAAAAAPVAGVRRAPRPAPAAALRERARARAPRARRGSSCRRSRRRRRRSAAASPFVGFHSRSSWFGTNGVAAKSMFGFGGRAFRVGGSIFSWTAQTAFSRPAAPAPAFRWPTLLLAEPSAIEPLGAPPKTVGEALHLDDVADLRARAVRLDERGRGRVEPGVLPGPRDRQLLADRVRRRDALALAVATSRRRRG